MLGWFYPIGLINLIGRKIFSFWKKNASVASVAGYAHLLETNLFTKTTRLRDTVKFIDDVGKHKS